MEQKNSINELGLKAIPDLYGKNFFIPDYQRGYRWGTRQVEQLMDDLCRFFDDKGKGEFYCLQPIVVKELTEDEKATYGLHSDTDDNRWYEVIDGQQRLTTIRIILALFKNVQGRFKNKFNIKYKTRPSLGEIFDKFVYDYDKDEYGITVDNEQNLDIDTWHILQAAKCVLAWLKEGEAQGVGLDYFTGIFLQYFTQQRGLDGKKSVQVIWYELRDKSDPNVTFKRLNDKKVALNNAELIRAMFLSDSAEYECDKSVIDGYPEEVQGISKKESKPVSNLTSLSSGTLLRSNCVSQISGHSLRMMHQTKVTVAVLSICLTSSLKRARRKKTSFIPISDLTIWSQNTMVSKVFGICGLRWKVILILCCRGIRNVTTTIRLVTL